MAQRCMTCFNVQPFCTCGTSPPPPPEPPPLEEALDPSFIKEMKTRGDLMERLTTECVELLWVVPKADLLDWITMRSRLHAGDMSAIKPLVDLALELIDDAESLLEEEGLDGQGELVG